MTDHDRLMIVARAVLCSEPTPGGPCMRRKEHPPNGHLPAPRRRARSANDAVESKAIQNGEDE